MCIWVYTHTHAQRVCEFMHTNTQKKWCVPEFTTQTKRICACQAVTDKKDTHTQSVYVSSHRHTHTAQDIVTDIYTHSQRHT